MPLPRRTRSAPLPWTPGTERRPVRPARGPVVDRRHDEHRPIPADPAAALRIPLSEVMSSPVVTARPDETLQTLARRMVRHGIGCVVVKDHGRVVGIVTERDILREAADGCRMDERRAEEMMSAPLVVGAEQDDLSTAIRSLVEANVKRLPVLRRGRLVGIVTFTDFARVEPRYAQTFREALEDASAQARRKFEGRLPSRAPDYTFI